MSEFSSLPIPNQPTSGLTAPQQATLRGHLGAAPATVIADHIGPVTIGATAAETWDVTNGRSASVTMTSAAKTINITNLPDGHEVSLTVVGAATTGALSLDNIPGDYTITGTIDTTGLTTNEYCIIGIKRGGGVALAIQGPTIS